MTTDSSIGNPLTTLKYFTEYVNSVVFLVHRVLNNLTDYKIVRLIFFVHRETRYQIGTAE